jgi:hypothetical protein
MTARNSETNSDDNSIAIIVAVTSFIGCAVKLVCKKMMGKCFSSDAVIVRLRFSAPSLLAAILIDRA